MRQLQASFTLILIAAGATAVAPTVRADTGIQIGARGGLQLLRDRALEDQNAPSVGAEARFGFELSPLIVALTFDHFFVADRTLFQIGANALYDLPIGQTFLYPYLGAGVGVTRFALPESPSTSGAGGLAGPATDSNGSRIGMNLIAGMRFDHLALPVARPFAQVMVSLGPIDLMTVVGGVLFELDGH